jgi:hypothetical protein
MTMTTTTRGAEMAGRGGDKDDDNNGRPPHPAVPSQSDATIS